MIARSLILALSVFLLVACSTTGMLYPMSGDIFEAGEKAPIEVKLTGVERNAGKMTLTAPDGEYFEGRWSVVAQAGNVTSWGKLMVQYDQSPGELASNPTSFRSTAYLVGDSGTTMDVEYVFNSLTSRGRGIAKDSRNNVYRLVF